MVTAVRSANVAVPDLGVLLLSFKPLMVLAYNREALEALAFAHNTERAPVSGAELKRHIREKLLLSSNGAPRFVTRFESGNRTYLCRVIPVNREGERQSGKAQSTLVLLERVASPSRLLERKAIAEFGLTRREAQMVDLLIQGMTTKEMAKALNLSPNTVKSFLRLVMTKMGVTTRSGVVGKVLRPRQTPNAG